MVKTFHISEATKDEHGNPICPECRNHKRLSDTMEQHRTISQAMERCGGEVDCKNLFREDSGEVKSQCCCYSEDHY